MEYMYLLFEALAIVLFAVVAMTALYYAAYALVCALAWIEDEAERAVQRSRRKARLRERARMYRAGIQR